MGDVFRCMNLRIGRSIVMYVKSRFFLNLRLIFIFNSLLQNSLFCVLFDPKSDDEIFEFLKFNLNVQNVNGSRCFII